ncbi:MAG: hypothetical protein KGP35_02765 [Bacteroidetes bacterium]|nr:hypothetical protein [Bacteroidota bacterium]
MDLIIVSLIILLIYFLQRNRWVARLAAIDRFRGGHTSENYIDALAGIHLLLSIVYILYASVERSDSGEYHHLTSLPSAWSDWWGTDTLFIKWLTWPLSNFLGLNYISCMLIFSYLGLNGVILFYFALKENLPAFNVRSNSSYSIVEWIFLLPNTHFWSSSIGKGATMLFGIGLIIFGLSRFQKRFLMIIFGSWFVFQIRGHILFLIIIGAGFGLFFTVRGVKWYYKGLMILAVLAITYFTVDDMSKYTGRNDLNLTESTKFQQRAISNTSATSGVDLGNYNQAQKLFTFWYRPLFVDGPGLLGFIVSFENALYVFFTIGIIRYGIPNWKHWNGWFRISFFIFIFGSIALAQIAGNLGIAMRQKAQIMPLFFILYCKAMSYKRL